MISSRLHRGARPMFAAGLALFAALALSATPARAAFQFFQANGTPVAGNPSSVPLIDLLPTSEGGLGYFLVVDDKTFFNFHSFSGIATGGATAVTADQITVSPIETSAGPPGSGPGLSYQSAFFNITGSLTSAVSQDTKFTYDVKVNSGANLLEDASLFMSGISIGSPTSKISIGETLTSGPPNFNPIATPSVFDINSPPPGGNRFFDQPFFTPVNFAEVNKDIALSMSQGATGNTAFSIMEQRFSQVAGVPEPSTMALAGLGALGLIGYGLRRRKASGA
jgi:hypothetical protein